VCNSECILPVAKEQAVCVCVCVCGGGGLGNELWPTQPPVKWLVGILLPGVKQPVLEPTTHLQSMLRLRMCGDTSPLPSYIFMAMCLIKQWMSSYCRT
jgi:hypothetical protein